ncbi:AAA family ATPase [Candidatus Parcubacteria bacterium]|nr:AAA family ATPase [Candidatus Parcubacteria bacterium]
MNNKLIKRRLFQELKEHLNKKEISFIIGPRQVGKTTLMRALQEEMENKGKKNVFLSFDFEEKKKL